MVVLVRAQKLGTASRYDLQQCVKRLKTKSQKVFGPNSYVSRKHREKNTMGWRDMPPPPTPNEIMTLQEHNLTVK